MTYFIVRYIFIMIIYFIICTKNLNKTNSQTRIEGVKKIHLFVGRREYMLNEMKSKQVFYDTIIRVLFGTAQLH